MIRYLVFLCIITCFIGCRPERSEIIIPRKYPEEGKVFFVAEQDGVKIYKIWEGKKEWVYFTNKGDLLP